MSNPTISEELVERATSVARKIWKRDEWGKGYEYETLGEFFGDQNGAKDWIIKGAIAWGETSAWIGAPGSLKSALMANLAVSLAFEQDWHGHRYHFNEDAVARFGILYFALERADLVRRRLEAEIKSRGLDANDAASIVVVPGIVDISTPDGLKKAITTVKNVEAFTEDMMGVVIFDTHAKLIAAFGGDEDKAKDQGRLFTNLARFKSETGDPHVALVGHTGKDESRGARGSNALYGDVDMLVTISGDTTKTATVVKANDMPEGPLFSFRSKVFEFGKDEDGDPITVNIVEPVEGTDTVTTPTRSRWSKGLRLVKDCIDDAMADSGIDYQIANGPTVRAVGVQDARAIHAKRYVSNGDGDRQEAERKAWRRNFKAARDAGLIAGEVSEGRDWIWHV
jgi:hypothetical protein